MRKILKKSWTKHLSLTYNEKYKYCNRPRQDTPSGLLIIQYLVVTGTWCGCAFFGTLSLVIYLLQGYLIEVFYILLQLDIR